MLRAHPHAMCLMDAMPVRLSALNNVVFKTNRTKSQIRGTLDAARGYAGACMNVDPSGMYH